MYEAYCLYDDKVYVILFDINVDTYDNTCGSQLGFIFDALAALLTLFLFTCKIDHKMPGLFIRK